MTWPEARVTMRKPQTGGHISLPLILRVPGGDTSLAVSNAPCDSSYPPRKEKNNKKGTPHGRSQRTKESDSGQLKCYRHRDNGWHLLLLFTMRGRCWFLSFSQCTSSLGGRGVICSQLAYFSSVQAPEWRNKFFGVHAPLKNSSDRGGQIS